MEGVLSKCVLILPLLISVVLSAESQQTHNTQPHVVIIVADDMGWGDVSFLGSRQIHTPTLDRLASEGLLLTQHYSEASCTPSRASLMTGRYPLRVGLHHMVINNGQKKAIPLEHTLLPEYMKNLGYRTHGLGKWHLGSFHTDYLPSSRGFDTFLGVHSGGFDHFDHTVWDFNDWAGFDWNNETNGEITFLNENFGSHSSALLTDEAQRIIRSVCDDEKLFLYVPFLVPHSGGKYDPLQPEGSEAYGAHENVWDPRRRAYAGMVKSLDNSVQIIMDTLEERGILDDTLLVFMSDNGASVNGIMFDENWGTNAPFRGMKTQLWEGGVRTPAFIWGDRISARQGQTSDELMHISDWLPTLTEALGGDVSSLGEIDGISHWQSFTGQSESHPRNEIMNGFDPLTGSVAYRIGSLKYIVNPGTEENTDNNWYTPPVVRYASNPLVPEDYTPLYEVQCPPTPRLTEENECVNSLGEKRCLYDLAQDPCEHNNLIDDPNYAEQLTDILKRVRHYCHVQVPVQDPPIDANSNPALWNFHWQPWTDDPTLPDGINAGCSTIRM